MIGKRYFANFTENIAPHLGLSNRPISIEIWSELDGAETTGLNAIFATGQILTDAPIAGIQVGDIIAISGSDNNDLAYTFAGFGTSGPSPYIHTHNVTPSPVTLEEDTSGFTATVTKATLERTCPTARLRKIASLPNKAAALFTGELLIQVLQEDTIMFDELLSIDETQMLARLIVDGQQYWQGYVMSEQFSRRHLPLPYGLSLKATDGIALLKDIPYPGVGIISALQHIKTCLDLTGNILEYNVGVNLFEENMVQTANCLDQVDIDSQIFTDDDGQPFSAYAVLTECLRRFNARLMQANGVWDIDRFDEVKNLSRVKYQLDSDLNQTGSVSTHQRNIIATDVMFVNDNQQLLKIAGWKYAVQEQLYGVLGGGTILDPGFEQWNDGTTLTHWTKNGGLVRNSDDPQQGQFSATLQTAPTVPDQLFNITQTSLQSVSGELTISFFCRWANPENKESNKARFAMQVGANHLQDYLTEDWDTSPAILEVDMGTEGFWTPVSFSVTPPAAGNLTLKFYNGIYAGGPNVTDPWTVSYDNLSVEEEDLIGFFPDGQVQTWVNFGGAYSKKGIEETLHIGDTFLSNPYTGQLLIASTPTALWNHRGSAGFDWDIGHITGRALLNQYRRATLKMTANFKGRIDPTQKLDDIYLQKDFLFMGMDWDLMESTYETEWEELLDEDFTELQRSGTSIIND